MENYLKSKKASQILGVTTQTLNNWDKNGKIKTIRTGGNARRFNVKEYLLKSGFSDNEVNKMLNIKISTINNEKKIEPSRRKICYCRVSTHSQKDDLNRQINYMKKKYPNYEIIKDVASGINFKRKGLLKIIDYCVKGELEELVVAYKDRLTRFGYEIIETLIEKYSNGKITVLKSCNESPQEELTKDLVSIINVFSAKLNGMRKYDK